MLIQESAYTVWCALTSFTTERGMAAETNTVVTAHLSFGLINVSADESWSGVISEKKKFSPDGNISQKCWLGAMGDSVQTFLFPEG